ncbi:MAG TPA: polyphenol oxidase family protein, partial [Acidobacteriaceae bacterium]|nr:polyphenol oxidase family protein [Acidobacteriaceae bacterium]
FPILVADTRQRIVAAFHAGWRGTLARIAERGVGRMRAEFGSRPEDLTAAIGPGIGPCCFSVGEKVRMEFRSQFAYAEELFKEIFDLDPVKQKYPMLFLTARAPGHSNLGPSIHLDLIDANRRQLLDAGLKPGAIHSLNLCTACDTKRFFSHRAEQGFTGRMLNVIGIV